MKHLAGTGALVRLALRRDRVRLPIWVLAIGVLVYSQAASIEGLYPDPADLARAAELVKGNAAFIAMAGPPVALETVGGRTAFEISAFAMVLAALMSAFLVTRNVRAEEESGRAEMVRSTTVGRHAAVAAALIVALLANAATFALCWAGLAAVGLPVAGSVALALGVALVGLAFAAVAVLTNQVTTGGRAASGLAGAALAAAYVLRAAGDVGDGVLSWSSPMGWGQALRPYGDERWWPVALLVGASLAVVGAALALADHRDVGAGLVHPRPGPARAAPRLLSPLGLALRLHRGSLVGWSVGLFLGGVAYGSIGGDVEDFIGDNEVIADMIASGGGDVVDAFFGTTSLVLAVIATGFTLQAALRARDEEEAGHLESLLATAASRPAWLASQLVVVIGGTAVVLAAAGLGTGLAYAVGAGDGGAIARQASATLVYLPAAGVLAGLAVALFGALPRALIAVWGALAGCFVLSFFGEVLSIPGPIRDLSPFEHVPRLPAAAFSLPPVAAVTAVAGVLLAVGVAAFSRRDIAVT